jgi:hypothetical protein
VKEKVLLIFLFLSLTFTPALAAGKDAEGQGKKPMRVFQTHVNATIITSDMKGTVQKLQGIVRQYNGMIQHLSSDSNNTTGSATIQIPPDKAASFLTELSAMGEVQNQSMSTSDYTNSCEEYTRKLKAYQVLAQVPTEKVFASIAIPENEKALVQNEFQAMIRSQIESCRSSLQSYERYGDFAQVSLSFRRADRNQQGQHGQPVPSMTLQVEEKKSGNEGALIALLCIAVSINFIFLLAVYRKIQKSPIGS